MEVNLEHAFLAQACTTKSLANSGDWRIYRAFFNGLVGLAGTLKCGAPEEIAQNLKGISFHGPIATCLEDAEPASIEILVTTGDVELKNPWIESLAAGAILVTIGSTDSVLPGEKTTSFALNLGSGVSVSLLDGCKYDALRDFLAGMAASEDARARAVSVLTALDSRLAYEDRLQAQKLTECAHEKDATIRYLETELAEEQAERARLMTRIENAKSSLNAVLASGSWPLLKRFRSVRRRITSAFNTLDQSLVSQQTPVLSDAAQPGVTRGAPDFRAPSSQAELLATIPQIAGWIHEHGMRPGGWVDPSVLAAMQAQDLTLVAKSFYSVCPDIAEMGDDDWRPNKYSEAWETVTKADFADLLPDLVSAAKALESAPMDTPKEQGVFFWNNEMFSPMDATSYRAIIQNVRPKQILEVGSGNSTAIALGVAEETGTSVRCIEPYPSPFLKALEGRLACLIQSKVEDVDPKIYRELEKGDILFIDSSHCARMSSDLNFLMFEALPRLKAGVLVHFHEIFLPNEYPETWLRDVGIMWNEQYQLLAFLMNNADYELLWSSSHAPTRLGVSLTEKLKEAVSGDHPIFRNIGPYGGGSVWLRKLN